MADAIYETLTPAFAFLTRQINNATKAYEALKRIGKANSSQVTTNTHPREREKNTKI
jgi:hypothetical protein